MKAPLRDAAEKALGLLRRSRQFIGYGDGPLSEPRADHVVSLLILALCEWDMWLKDHDKAVAAEALRSVNEALNSGDGSYRP